MKMNNIFEVNIMTAREIMNDLFSMAQDVDYSNTCDTCKAGNPDREVKKIAVSMFATPEIVERQVNGGQSCS